MHSEEIFRAAGFVHDPSREVWFNRDHRKLFSYEALREHNSEWVKGKLLENVPKTSFDFIE